jgi:hypothetical protein
VKVFLQGVNIKLLEFLAVIEATSIWVGLCIELTKNVQVQGLGPPIGLGRFNGGLATVPDWATCWLIAHFSP